MASSIASRPPVAPKPNENAARWARGLGAIFSRVALFEVRKTTAHLSAVHGLDAALIGREISLTAKTPLRWAVEAASPIVGSGRAPGGGFVAARLGIFAAPRAYAVIPLVVSGRLIALAYGDCADTPLPANAVAEVFAYCDRVLSEGRATKSSERAAVRSTARRPLQRRARRPELIDPHAVPPSQETDELSHMALELALKVATDASIGALDDDGGENGNAHGDAHGVDYDNDNENDKGDDPREHARAAPTGALPEFAAAAVVPPPLPAAPATLDLLEAEATLIDEVEPIEELESDADFTFVGEPPPKPMVVTPQGLMGRGVHRRILRNRWLLPGALAAGVVVALIAAAFPLAPVSGVESGERIVEIPTHTTAAAMAAQLESQGLVRNARAFEILARVTGIDRNLKAGTYRLSTGAWAWTVLGELHDGQVSTVTVTIPEGLSLREIATLLENANVVPSADVLVTARDPDLLEQLNIPSDSVEGYLFPETYTFARGLPAAEVIGTMVDQFFLRLFGIDESQALGPRDLHERVTLASIVQREVKHLDEIKRVAGVFQNRMDRYMRLESCATVQYLLGKPKDRLLLTDLRIQSPYNTYLQPGLPPGPIASPGMAALQAAFTPEEHDFLFFVAREDGSDRHIFTRTFAAHERAQQRVKLASARRN